MYIPHIYRNEDLEDVLDFIRQHSFAILVNQVEDQPWASHIPLELEKNESGENVLTGHLARANPQWKSFSPDKEVLAIFHGPHTYVSSSWYREEEVPTWNYIAVHVYGRIRLMEEDRLWKSLKNLVDRYERESENPVSLENMSGKTLRQIKGIVGFEISIDKVQAAYKLSQGREQDHTRIVGELRKKGDDGSTYIAGEIMKKKPE